MKTYQPLFARVLIEREVKEKSKGGIIMPNAKHHAPCEGTVIAVGPTADGVKVGDRVLFGRQAGAWLDAATKTTHEDGEGTLFICTDEDILCKVEGEEK